MGTDQNKAIGQAIQKLRIAAGLSQIELAQKLNELGESFHQQTVVKVENGTRPLKFTEAVRVAEALNVSLNMLTKDTEQIDATAELQRRITRTAEAMAKVYHAAKEAQKERIDLAETLRDYGSEADSATVQAARFALSEDLPGQCRLAMQDVLEEQFGTLPGLSSDSEMLELMGWSASEATDGDTAT